MIGRGESTHFNLSFCLSVPVLYVKVGKGEELDLDQDKDNHVYKDKDIAKDIKEKTKTKARTKTTIKTKTTTQTKIQNWYTLAGNMNWKTGAPRFGLSYRDRFQSVSFVKSLFLGVLF